MKNPHKLKLYLITPKLEIQKLIDLIRLRTLKKIRLYHQVILEHEKMK